MDKYKKKLLILTISTIVILCICLVKKTFQNDTFYTIQIGKWILNNGVDLIDHYSIHTLPYTYPHWLYDVFIGFIYNLFGLTGIYISTIILFIILIMIFYYILIKTNKNYLVSLVFVILAILAIIPFVTARAQLITYILFIIEFYALEQIYKDKNNFKVYGLLLLFISLLICNIHCATWIFYFILFLPFIGEYIVSLFMKSNKKIAIEKNNNIKYLLLIMLLSIITGFITPIGDTPFTYVFKLNQSNALLYVNEHQSLPLYKSPISIIMILEGIIIGVFSNTKVKLRDVFLICGLILMAIVSERHVSYLVIIGAIAISRIIGTFFNDNETIDKNICEIVTSKIGIVIISMLVLTFGCLSFYNNYQKEYIDSKIYPVNASNYIINNLNVDKIRLFNFYNYGSYLLYRNIPVYIDSRADLYTKAFNHLDYDILDDEHNIDTIYKQIFERDKISHILIINYTKLYHALIEDKDYKIIYSDKEFTLFETINY